MRRAASAFLEQFAPSSAGVLGLAWGSSRAEVWAQLPEPARRTANGLGARFFTTTYVLVESVSTVLHFQFSGGLHAVSVTPLRPLHLWGAMITRFGPPSSVRGTPVTLRAAEWRDARGWMRLVERADVPDTLLFGPPAERLTDLPSGSTSPELEDLLPRQAEIQRLLDVGNPAEAGALFGRRRLLSGYCPNCGLVIGAGHASSCSLKPGNDTCEDCYTGRAELGRFCLPCAQRQRIQSSLRQRR